jgi:hypothetical protein
LPVIAGTSSSLVLLMFDPLITLCEFTADYNNQSCIQRLISFIPPAPDEDELWTPFSELGVVIMSSKLDGEMGISTGSIGGRQGVGRIAS